MNKKPFPSVFFSLTTNERKNRILVYQTDFNYVYQIVEKSECDLAIFKVPFKSKTALYVETISVY